VPMKIKITRSNAPSTSHSLTGNRGITQSKYQDQKGRRRESRGCDALRIKILGTGAALSRRLVSLAT
jgi:hypothetical protein